MCTACFEQTSNQKEWHTRPNSGKRLDEHTPPFGLFVRQLKCLASRNVKAWPNACEARWLPMDKVVKLKKRREVRIGSPHIHRTPEICSVCLHCCLRHRIRGWQGTACHGIRLSPFLRELDGICAVPLLRAALRPWEILSCWALAGCLSALGAWPVGLGGRALGLSATGVRGPCLLEV